MNDTWAENLPTLRLLDPALWTAAFQLGLLQLTQTKIDAAKNTWSKLDALPADSPLQLFRQGLECLADNQFDQARTMIEQGISANTFSLELNQDMQKILASLPTETKASAQNQPTEPAGRHVWVSAYEKGEGNDAH